MEQYIIKGGAPLVGEVEIGGAKNAALAILAAATMTDESVLIENVPDVRDTNAMMQAMESIGVVIERIDRHTVRVNAKNVTVHAIEDDYIKKIRASYYLIGALLGKYKEAEVSLPGGCNIGSRPIDLHIKGFRALGAKVEIKNGAAAEFDEENPLVPADFVSSFESIAGSEAANILTNVGIIGFVEFIFNWFISLIKQVGISEFLNLN